MAKIKQSTKHVATNLVLEDPRPGSSTLYILGDAHDFSSLSPIFAKSLTTSVSGQQGFHIGGHDTGFATNASYTVITDNAGQSLTALLLTKGSSAVHQTNATGNNRFTNIDLQWAASLDPQYTPTGSSVLSNNSTTGIMFYLQRNTTTSATPYVIFTGVGSQQELYDVVPSLEYPAAVLTATPVTSIIPYVDPVSSRIPIIARAVPGTSAIVLVNFRPAYMGPWPNIITQFDAASLTLQNTYGQFIGISSTGAVLYLTNLITDDHTQSIVSHDLGDNSTSYLNQFTAVRTAFGGAAGDTRSTASGINQQIKLSSTLFEDPDNSDLKGFYCPYFDVNNDFQPYYFQWNPATDTVVRNEDVSVITEAGSSDFYATNTVFNNLSPGPQGFAGHSAAVFCETFTFTQGQTTTRYLTLGAIHGSFAEYDDSPVKRTFVTFEIDSTDPKKLIFHSQFTAAGTPRNIVWLNDSKTLLGVFLFSSFKIYNFTSATGWVEAQTINEQFWAVGRDRIDRIWGAAKAINSDYTDLHLITPALPVTIRIVPENTTYNYQGVTINTFVQVEAINVQGNRIEADITLVIDGPTFAFADDSKSQVVRTSASGSISVPIKITDSGFSQIIASVTI